jgi:sulfatase-like protein
MHSFAEFSAPFCVAAISVLYYFSVGKAYRVAGWGPLGQTLLLALGIAAVITGLFLIAFRRNRRLAAPLATLACMALLLAPPAFVQMVGLVGVAFLVSVAPSVIQKASPLSSQEMSGWVLIFGMAFYGVWVVFAMWHASPAGRLSLPPVVEASTLAASKPPDIFYIIVDGYGRSDVLRELYGVDNSAFIEALQDRGFFVASESRSNYIRTIRSLASSLNMSYLTPISAQMGNSDAYWPVTRDLIGKNQVMEALKAMGYRIVATTDVSDVTDIGWADTHMRPYAIHVSDLDQAWLGHTAFSVLPAGLTSRFMPTMSYESKRRVASATLAELPKVASTPGPKFVFAHILLPHPPFVFAADGTPVDPPYPFLGFDGEGFPGSRQEYVSGYAGQVEFLDSQLLGVIDGILRNSETPPIIVIQGDHGPGSRLDTLSIDNSCLWERFSILNAYYLPGVAARDIPPDITPVNTFRLIYNHYFSTEIPLLPNRQYFSEGTSLYDFIDVTDRVGTSCVGH